MGRCPMPRRLLKKAGENVPLRYRYGYRYRYRYLCRSWEDTL